MSDATSADPTAVLFGLEEEFSVLKVQRIDAITVKMIIEQTAREGPCPACGVLTSAVKEGPLRRLKDLLASGQMVELWWRKRRLECREVQCRQHSFTQVCGAVRPHGRVTERLRHRVAKAIAENNRAVSDVARECTGACVREWLGEQLKAFRKRIEIVVMIDPSAPYASGIRATLPDVKLAVDIWHLVALANQMVTEVRQRATRHQLGRRGTSRDLIWVNRRLLLTRAEHLTRKQIDRLWRSFDSCDPTKEIQAAWAVKERLRLLLTTRTVQDPMAAGRFLRGRDRRAPARGHPTRQDCRNLVAGDPDCPHPRCQQCPHRRLQPDNQTDQAGRARVQITSQLPAPYPQPHRGHTTAKISSMNGSARSNSKSRLSTPGSCLTESSSPLIGLITTCARASCERLAPLIAVGLLRPFSRNGPEIGD